MRLLEQEFKKGEEGREGDAHLKRMCRVPKGESVPSLEGMGGRVLRQDQELWGPWPSIRTGSWGRKHPAGLDRGHAWVARAWHSPRGESWGRMETGEEAEDTGKDFARPGGRWDLTLFQGTPSRDLLSLH